MIFLLLVIVGLFAGVMSGLLGVGGGTIFTPVLFFIFDRSGVANPELWTIGTSLFCTFAASSGGSLKHLHQNSSFIRESLHVGVFGIIGTTLGKLIATSVWFSREEFLILIAVVMLYTGINFLIKSLRKPVPNAVPVEVDSPIRKRDGAVAGGAGGFLAAMSGLGGGVLMVPIMNLFFKNTLRKSVSVSEFAIVMISLAGWIQYALRSPNTDLPVVPVSEAVDSVTPFAWGYVDFGACLPMVLGAFIGAGIGVWLHDRLNVRVIRFIFATLILIVAGRMIFELF